MSTTASGSARTDHRGFSLIELLMVIAIVAVLGMMAIAVSPAYLRTARADAGLSQALDLLRTARETAISQRRNVQVQFIGNDGMQTVRVNIPPPGTTVLRTIQLENRMRFMLEPGVADDTPDRFGNPQAIAFGAAVILQFTSEGTFVDQNGNILNGTLFIAIPNERNSARAITIFGATALIRVWRWDGREWVE